MKNKTIGFIGLGIMGKPMASHLLKAGFALVACDVDPERVANLVQNGASKASNPREVAERSQVIITMLPDSPDVEKVVLGEKGLIEAIRPGQVFIDMSTISPIVTRRLSNILETKGVHCLDAPVSGGETGAINATLSIMVGGEAEVFEEARPIFEVLGKTITHCGPAGSGQIVKACNQIQVAFNLVGMAEAFTLGVKAGVDPEIILKVLSGGYAQTRVMDVRGPKVIVGDYQPGFKSKFHLKDLKIISQTAQELNCPLPVTALIHELFTTMIAQGRGDLDHSGIISVIEDMAQIKVRTRNAADS